MRHNYQLYPIVIGVLTILSTPQTAIGSSNTEVAKIAQDITVLIDGKQGSGSGVLIRKEDKTYTILTTSRVVEKKSEYIIITPDAEHHKIQSKDIKKLPDLDLALLQFTSDKNYSVAKVGNSQAATVGTTAYVAGFPTTTIEKKRLLYDFPPPGKIIANASQPLPGGYSLVYRINTLPGMGGGPILNEQGELIGIHGLGNDKLKNEESKFNPIETYVKTGRNFGIPIDAFLRLSKSLEIDVGFVAPENNAINTPPTTSTADDFYIKASGKAKSGNFQEAIVAYDQAIRLNPQYADAYNDRGVVNLALGNFSEGIKDFEGALQIDPQYSVAYVNLGIVRLNSNDYQQAITNFDQALKINSNLADAYLNRGKAHFNMGEREKAIADYDRALKIDPNYAQAYDSRAIARFRLGDKQGAIEDFSRTLKLNPQNATAYYNRGVARSRLGEDREAISDYNRALEINPDYAQAYGNRGLARLRSGDKEGAIADLQTASDVFLKLGKQDDYDKAQKLIEKLQEQ